MKAQIVLSADNWTTPDDIYVALLSSLKAPQDHGHNLDALWDSLTGSNINGVNPPFSILVTGIHVLPEDCKTLLIKIKQMISEANDAGVEVEMICR